MTTPGTLQDQRILLIDDDQSIRVALAYYFRNKVRNITVLETAEKALVSLETEVYDIIISDYRLPGMDGLAFFQELQRLDLPVLKVLITAHGDLELSITAIKAGVHDFILKPLNAQTVEQSLIKLLDKTPARPSKLLMDHKTLEELRWHFQEKYEILLRKTAHKMNNILHVIAGNADMGLLELGDNAQVIKRFTNIISKNEEMMELVKEMTHYSEPESRGPVEVDVSALVDKSIENYEDIMKKDGILLKKSYGVNINVSTYSDDLYKIIDNTLLNAIQTLSEASRDDKILNLCINKERSTVHINIVDNACSMDPDNLENVTMKNFTTKPAVSGLGLHIADILSRKIGATIIRKSEPGRGTDVEITLPLETPAVAADKERCNLPEDQDGGKRGPGIAATD